MNTLFEQPWHIESLNECAFYHTIDLPGLGIQPGHWDLRKGIDLYLSSTDFRNKHVLEIGTANGFVCFELEKRGAEVVAFDLAEGFSYDIVPYHSADLEKAVAEQSEGVRRVKNAFWLAHRLFYSRARVVYGHVNEIPSDIGAMDIVFVGNVLQHLENPFRAIISAAQFADQIIVTEANWNRSLHPDEPIMFFLPDPKDDENLMRLLFSWWQVTPGLLIRWFQLLGYRITEQYEHEQYFCKIDKNIPHFTIVATRE